MKTSIKTQLSLLLVLSIFIIGCNQLQKDWEKTKQSNSIEEVKKFLAKNPACEFEQEAKYYLDSLEWIKIQKSNNIDSLELFLKDHSKSEYLLNAEYALDSIYWKLAYYSKDTNRLKDYIIMFPSSNKLNDAFLLIKEIVWTPILIDSSSNSYKLIFPQDTILSLIMLKQKYHLEDNATLYSIGKKEAEIQMVTEGVRISGDFAIGNLKFFNANILKNNKGFFLKKGTILVFSIPKI